MLELLLVAVSLAAARVDDAHAAWSHDGRYVAFDRTRRLGSGATNASIVVVRSDGRSPRDITSTSAPFDAVRPVWSRDSRWIAFDVGSDLLPTTVQWGRRDGRSANAVFTGGGLFSTASPPSWSPDGRTLAIAGRLGGSSGVYIVGRDTGRMSRVSTGDVRNAAWSPDGRRIAYADAVSLALVVPGNGRVTRLPAPPARLAWSPDGRRIAYAAGCAVGVVSVRATGAPPGLMPCPAEVETSTPSWSPDGTRIAYSVCRRPVCSTFVVPVSGSAGVQITQARDPAWSPDGRLIAYTRVVGSAATRIWLVRPDGHDARPLLRANRRPAAPSDFGEVAFGGAVVFAALALVSPRAHAWDSAPLWSPDGTKVAFVRSLGRKVDLYVVDARTSRVRRIATRVAPESRPSWSPDGRRLVYSRIGPTAPVELPDVVVVREDGKKRLRIGAGRTPLWSPVGGAIAFAGYDGLDIVRPDGRRLRQVVTPGPAALWSWSADGELLAFSGKGLDVVAAAGGPAHVVALEGWRASWAPRRRRVAYTNGCGLGVFDVTDDPSHYDASIPPPCLPVGVEGFPSWSSDGAKIVFSFCRSLLGCLVESGVAGRISGLEATRIVCGIDPQWSPVADEVVFASSEPSRSLPCPAVAPTSLYLMQPDGTGIRRLTGRAR